MKRLQCSNVNSDSDSDDAVCTNYGSTCDEGHCASSPYRSVSRPEDETTDHLGSFLTQYDEYLDGSRSYDDLPTASGAHPFYTCSEQSVPKELTKRQREKLRVDMKALKVRLDKRRLHAAIGPTSVAVNTTTDLVNLHTSVTIFDLFHSGRITAKQAAWLYEVRRLLAWKRRPWWARLIIWLFGGGP